MMKEIWKMPKICKLNNMFRAEINKREIREKSLEPKVGSLKMSTKLANPQPGYLESERENTNYQNQE